MIAFTGLALSSEGFRKSGPRSLPGSFGQLPAGVPIYVTHDWLDAQWELPVGVAVPRRAGDSIEVDGVLATSDSARVAAKRIVCGLDNRLSIVGNGPDDATARRPGGGVMRVQQVLYAVDLVALGADPAARITATRAQLTDAELEVQRRLDSWLAAGPPTPPELLARAAAEGTSGLDALFASITEPLVTPVLRLQRMNDAIAAAYAWDAGRTQ